MVTDTIWPFGGQRTSGVAVSAEIFGGTTAGKLGQAEGPRSCICDAPIPVERVSRAVRRRFVFDVEADRPVSSGYLAGRVPRNDVPADGVAGRTGLNQDAVRVATDAVVFDQVPATRPDETDTEVVVGRDCRYRCAQRGRTDGTVAAEETVHDVIVVAVDKAVSPTRRRARIGRVPTETILSITLSVMPLVNSPLKQLWCDVMSCIVTLVLTPAAPKIGCRAV